jgi:hypothetical protein
MDCPRCGETTNGRFCGNCGAAIGETTPDLPQTLTLRIPANTAPAPLGKPSAKPARALWILKTLLWIMQTLLWIMRRLRGVARRLRGVARRLRGVTKDTAIWMAIGVASILGLSFAVFASGLLSSNATSPSPSPRVAQGSGLSRTPHDICVLQVNALVTHFVQGRYGQEMRLNGYGDPFLPVALTISGKLRADQHTVGVATAKKTARATAASSCTTELQDRVRANYPTDGTYPADGSSDSSGASG